LDLRRRPSLIPKPVRIVRQLPSLFGDPGLIDYGASEKRSLEEVIPLRKRLPRYPLVVLRERPSVALKALPAGKVRRPARLSLGTWRNIRFYRWLSACPTSLSDILLTYPLAAEFGRTSEFEQKKKKKTRFLTYSYISFVDHESADSLRPARRHPRCSFSERSTTGGFFPSHQGEIKTGVLDARTSGMSRNGSPADMDRAPCVLLSDRAHRALFHGLSGRTGPVFPFHLKKQARSGITTNPPHHPILTWAGRGDNPREAPSRLVESVPGW